jgi:pyridoxamine-phosphate oxidase
LTQRAGSHAGLVSIQPPDPFQLFADWYNEAVQAGEPHPDAITLATAAIDGAPSARMVLFKGVVGNRFRFFTDYRSRKAHELEENPRAAIVFYWQTIHRQVRVEGTTVRTDREESEAYWASRPRESRLSALASCQSSVIPDYSVLKATRDALREHWAGLPIPRPSDWGGYYVLPLRVEFWRGQADRLHERQLYNLRPSGWDVEILSP